MTATSHSFIARSHREVLIAFAGLATGMFLAALNVTMVSTGLPTMVAELDGLTQLSWVVTAYLLAAIISVLLLGKMSDLYGRKPLFQTAIVIFVVGSTLCGLAQTMGHLIGSRAVQGVGGGALIALAQSTTADLVPPRQRGRYLGYIGAVFAVSSVIGPLLGGLFVDHLTWRLAFFINLPLGLVVLILTGHFLHLSDQRRQHHIDYLGASLVTVGLTCLLLVMVWGGDVYEWGSPVILALTGAASTAFVVFVSVERRALEPIIPLALFANHTFRVGNILHFIIGMVLFGAITFMPLFLQGVKGVSATNSGLLLFPLGLGFSVATITSGRLITRWGRYKFFPIGGTALATVSFALLTTMDATTSLLESFVYMAMLGLGIGMVHQVMLLAIQNAVDPRHLGVATSVVQLFRMIGGTVGVAMFGVVLNSRLSASLANLAPDMPSAVDPRTMIDHLTALTSLPAELQEALQQGLTDGITYIFALSVPLIALACAISFFLREIPLRDYELTRTSQGHRRANCNTPDHSKSEPTTDGPA